MLFYPNFTFANINIEYVTTFQRRTVATSSRKEVEISRWVNRRTVDQEASQSKSVKLHYFCIFMYIYEDFSDLCGVFLFAEILPNHATCQNCPICQSAKLSKSYRQTSQIITKRLSVATVIIGALVYLGVSSQSLIHALAIPSSSWGSAPPVTADSV